MLCTANGVIFCEIYPQSVAHNDITTFHDLIKIILFKVFLTDPGPLILDPSFEVSLKAFLIKIALFFNTFKQ